MRLADAIDQSEHHLCEDTSSFNWDRHCDRCGRAVATDRAIYRDDEPFACGDTLYSPGCRNGYWYAVCLLSRDPDTRWGDNDISDARRNELVLACADVGLEFGIIR